MLFKLSLKNIRKSMKDYSIYFLTLVFAVSIFYVFNSVDAQSSMLVLTEYKHSLARTLVSLIGYCSIFVSIILGFLIVYSNNFLIRRRKKEIGLYFTLGMSKKKVSLILVIETIVIGVISLVVGLLLGVVLSQFLSIFTIKLFEADMSNFKFVFSNLALVKTILYFGIIYIFVMLFNLFTLSRYKLINLLTANKKNERVKIRNKVVTIITFVLSLVCIGIAYKLLFDGALFEFGNNTIVMLILGAIGTFLFFLSLSGFLLRVIEMNKKVYLRGLNMFILKQINNKINTSVVSTTLISLMLLLTIGILSGSMSLVNAYNSDFNSNNLVDFTIMSGRSPFKADSLKDFPNFEDDTDAITSSDTFKKLVKNYCTYRLYYNANITLGSLLTEETRAEVTEQYKTQVGFDALMPLMLESDYNNLMSYLGRDDLKYSIGENQYLLMSNVQEVLQYYQISLDSNLGLLLNDTTVYPGKKEIINLAIENSAGSSNAGIIVVDDSLVSKLVNTAKNTVGNYLNSSEETDEEFVDTLSSLASPGYIRTVFSMKASGIGIKVIVTFIGLYLGIIFAITSATILAIGQLSESSDNKERYLILKQLGADNKLIKKSLFRQISIAFILPLSVALIHSYFGLRELNNIIKIFGNIDLVSNIFLTALFIVVVYGGYFIATYLCSKNIITENNNKN